LCNQLRNTANWGYRYPVLHACLRVLVNADNGVHPNPLNSRFGYVSISRASHDATLFTNDMAKLSPQLSADVSKTSALEINQAPSITQGIGMM
jgi:hypothetical protein